MAILIPIGTLAGLLVALQALVSQSRSGWTLPLRLEALSCTVGVLVCLWVLLTHRRRRGGEHG